MLIHLLQRASMDRELGYSATRPLTETVLSRHPSSVTSHHSSHTQQDVNNASKKSLQLIIHAFGHLSLILLDLTPASSKNVRAASVGCTPLRNKTGAQQPAQQPAEIQTSQPASEATQSLDNQLRALDQFYQNKVFPLVECFLLSQLTAFSFAAISNKSTTDRQRALPKQLLGLLRMFNRGFNCHEINAKVYIGAADREMIYIWWLDCKLYFEQVTMTCVKLAKNT